jgi:hypothetical protein
LRNIQTFGEMVSDVRVSALVTKAYLEETKRLGLVVGSVWWCRRSETL